MLKVDYISPDGLIIDSFEMADCMTINQAACTICPDTSGKFPVPTIAFVGAKPAVKELGDWDFPLSDARIQFRQLAMGGGGGGGGSNPLQIVLQVAITALAVIASIYFPPAIGLAAGTLGAMFVGGLAGAAVMMLGTLLMGALFQNKPSVPQGQWGAYNAEQASPTYNINASGNQARLYQTEPELFGRMKIVPDFVAQTWTEYIDNDQIGYFVYGIGRGHYDIESLQFGETVFWQNGSLVSDTGYEIQDLQIIQPGSPVTIFPDNVTTSDEVNGQQLFAPNDEEYDGAIGPYTTNPPGTVTNRIMLDFVFQQGVGHYKEDGSLEDYFIQWSIQLRKIDDFGNPLSDWIQWDYPTIEMATATPQRITKSYPVDEGRYQVRVDRISYTEGDGRTLDTLLWGSMKAMLPGTYIYPITCVAFSVKANNALTQAASRQFSVIATRKLPLYNRATKTWSGEVATRSWAAAISHVCKCEWGGRLKDSDFDLDTLWAIDAKLQAKGWHYDSYIDGPYLVWTLLCEMCQSQCVIPRFVGPILSFVQDAPSRPPSFALTPRNIMRSSFSVNYVTWSDSTPDDVTVDYLDAEYGFQQRDVTAILPESESQEPSSLTILGITNRKHAHSVAVAYAAHNRWQRVKVECQVEALGRLINLGDVCTVAHPRFKNTCAGVIKSWNESKLLVCIQLDMAMPEDDIDGFYHDRSSQSDYPITLDRFTNLGIINPSNKNQIIIDNQNRLLTNLNIQSKARLAVVPDDKYIAFTRPDGSIWGPCKIATISDTHIWLDAGDYATLLLQGQGNPFEFFTWGKDSQPTTWTLYSARMYQRLMIVNSVKSQDALHYSLELLNYTDEIYSYDYLPVPIWQGRGQLPDETGISPPAYVKGTVESDTRVRISWLSVLGATWYEVQVSSGESWTSLGRISETQILASVNPGKIYARVRAGNAGRVSTWSTWSGNTEIKPPAKPAPILSGSYNGSASISWPAVSGATRYAINLTSGGNRFYTATQTGTSFQITPEIQTGGPYRNLSFNVAAANQNGASAMGSVVLSRPAPAKITGANISISGNSAIINSVTPALSGITGYLVAQGTLPNFTINQVLELRQVASLPYTWSNLGSGTKYFRIAAKDTFYDSFHDPFQLNWSDVFIVEIP